MSKQKFYEHGNLMLDVSSRGITRKGNTLIYKDTQEPSPYVLKKRDDDKLEIYHKNMTKITDRLNEDEMDDLGDAVFLMRKYAFEHDEDLYLSKKYFLQNTDGYVLENVRKDNINLPVTHKELESIARLNQAVTFNVDSQHSFTLPQNLKAIIDGKDVTFSNDHFYSLKVTDENGNYTNDFSNIKIDTNTYTNDYNLFLQCASFDDIKLPEIDKNKCKNIYLNPIEGSDIHITKSLYDLVEKHPEFKFTLNHIDPDLVRYIYEPLEKNQQSMNTVPAHSLRDLKELLGHDYISRYAQEVKEFYLKTKTDMDEFKRYNITEDTRIDPRRLNRIERIEDKYESDLREKKRQATLELS